jgi:outer membrane protein
VLPDGKITNVVTDRIGLPAGAQSKASNSFVPTIAAEYFLSPNLSVETICCVTPHDVNGSGSLSGAKLVNNAIILPATVTLKYHLANSSVIKPYVGAGPTRFFIFSEGVGATARTLGATAVNLKDDFGFALQAGTDIKLNDRGLGLSIDAKRYFVDTTAVFRAGNTTVLETRHKLDPWVLSAGLAYRF